MARGPTSATGNGCNLSYTSPVAGFQETGAFADLAENGGPWHSPPGALLIPHGWQQEWRGGCQDTHEEQQLCCWGGCLLNPAELLERLR